MDLQTKASFSSYGYCNSIKANNYEARGRFFWRLKIILKSWCRIFRGSHLIGGRYTGLDFRPLKNTNSSGLESRLGCGSIYLYLRRNVQSKLINLFCMYNTLILFERSKTWREALASASLISVYWGMCVHREKKCIEKISYSQLAKPKDC